MSFATLILLVGLTVAGARIETGTWKLTSDTRRLARGAGVGITFWFAVMASSLAPLVLLVLGPVVPNGESGRMVATTFLFILIAIGLGAGWRLFYEFAQGKPLAEVRKRVFLGALAVGSIFALTLFRVLDLQVLRALGVYSTAPSSFAIVTPGLLGEFHAAGISIRQQANDHPGEATHTGDRSLYIATAFVRYRFGNQLVLCTEGYDPLQPSLHRGSSATGSFNVPTASNGCLDVHSDDVRRIMHAHAAAATLAKPTATPREPPSSVKTAAGQKPASHFQRICVSSERTRHEQLLLAGGRTT